ncbi:MAG: hypothetical protein ACFCVD_04825 [Nodosilinea sp.]
MSSGPSFLDLIKQTTEAAADFIEWVVALFRHDDWFKLLVLAGVVLALLGSVFREWLESLWPGEATPNALWISLWTAVVLFFIGAFVVALVKRPRLDNATAADTQERLAIKGLRPFGPEDAEIFCQLQRQGSLRECAESVTSPNYKFGILMGESGCGKTSFLQAGLWPRLREDTCSHRGILVRFSDQEPIETIRKALADQLEIPLEWLGIPLSSPLAGEETGGGSVNENSGASPFLLMLQQAVATAGKPIVLLCDQFEQFFVHYKRKEDRETFVQALTAWYKTPALNNVKLLVAIRADLLHELYALHTALEYTLGPQDLTKLEKFSPAEAAKILGIIAQTENLAFDPRFVQELAAQELASADEGTISPVDLQILAWMIERQTSDDLRAFNRKAFQKFGGVEGLLTRFLDRTLAARVLPNQRQAAVKTLLALTDLDQQVRAGVLNLAELQTKLQGDVRPEDLAEAVAWLSRSDVRLITPQDKSTATGYELAHERLIPALVRLAGKELTAADRANQLRERRVNEWLGNQSSPRYLLNLRELRQIQRQRPYLVWGAKRQPKERLIALSRRRAYGWMGAVGALVVTGAVFYGWWQFTPQGQVQQVQWQLSRLVGRASDENKAQVAVAYIKNNQREKGFDLIQNKINSHQAKAYALGEVAALAPKLPTSAQPLALLARALSIAETLEVPSAKASALLDIAIAYATLEDGVAANTILDQALAFSETINDQYFRADGMRNLVAAAATLEDGFAAKALLDQALALSEVIDNSYFKARALRDIAAAAATLEDGAAAKVLLDQALALSNAIDDTYTSASADALRDITAAAATLEDGAVAKAFLNKALAFSEAIDDNKARALHDIAAAFATLEDEAAAKALLEQAAALSKTIDEPLPKAHALRDIASIFATLEDEAAAKALLEQAAVLSKTIDEPHYEVSMLIDIAATSATLADEAIAKAFLDQALALSEAIEDPAEKSFALLTLATASTTLADGAAAKALLDQVLVLSETIDNSSSKADMLSYIAVAYGQLGDTNAMHLSLLGMGKVAKAASASSTLVTIASYQALYGHWRAALSTLKTALEGEKVMALTQMLTHHAESKTPQIIEGPVVLVVTPTSAAAGQYTLAVTLQSPDESCKRHVDWWEVLTEDGELVDRHILNAPHPFEKPFTTEKTITAEPDQVLIVRAHFSGDIENYNQQVIGSDIILKYPTQAMKGTLAKGFTSIRLPARFAAGVERQAPQPGECKRG